MELCNHPLDVESAKLTAPPKGESRRRLAIGGRLLVVWSPLGYLSDHESDRRYHLAFYHPDHGWCACRWDEKYGAPDEVLPISESAIWVSTARHKLIHFSAGDEVRATMLASAENIFHLLYTTLDNLWVREEWSAIIEQLHLQKEGLTIVDKKFIHFPVISMYPLADGAWMMIREDYKGGCFIMSPSLKGTIYERKGKISFHRPFIVRLGRKHCYHTEDPRCGWRKMPISIENESDAVLFFAKHNDIYLAAVYRHQGDRTLLYRFSDKSEMNAEHMWEIPERLYPEQFAEYNGLVCIVRRYPLTISGREDVPENHGFLVWDPRSDAFYEDIPQFSIIHARHIILHELQIPATWLEDKGRDIRDV